MSVLAIHDPEALLRHRGFRVTIVMPLAFALGVVLLDNDNIGLFASFGAFALLGFADFGGQTVARTRAYLILSVVGVVLIALGTLVSEYIVVGAIVLALVAFAIRLAGVFGGYFAAGGQAALLMFVIAAMVPAPPDQLVSREVGFLIAAALSIAVASVLWPVHERQKIRHAAADVADALAQVVRADIAAVDGRRADVGPLHDQLDTLRDLYGRTGLRPAGPTRHDQALVRLLDQLQRAVSFASRLEPSSTWAVDDAGPPVDDAGLADVVAANVEHTAQVLRRTIPPELATDLERRRDEHRDALEAWVADALQRGLAADAIVARLRGVFPLRVLSHAALSCDGDAVLAVGGSLPPDEDELLLDTPPAAGTVSTVARALALLGPHLRPDSVAFRNALRGAVALPIALVLADLVHAEHGFWVVLGTLTVLKSSAMRTGITALQALAGNLIGFVVAAVVMVAFGERTGVLWALLPVAVFLAAYAPAAIHFVIGQASFTVLVVILFNILQPQGWRTGLVRVESVALGAAVSLVVGVVFWPRGNRQALRDATAVFYRSVSVYVGATLATLTGAGGEQAGSARATAAVAATRRTARAAELRADEALFDLLTTPNTPVGAVPAWARLTSVGRSLRLVGDGIRALSQRALDPLPAGDDQRQLAEMADASVAEVAAVGDRVVGLAPRSADVGPAAADDPLIRWLGHVERDDPSSVGRTVAMAWSIEWLEVIDALVDLDQEPIDVVEAGARQPWWR